MIRLGRGQAQWLARFLAPGMNAGTGESAEIASIVRAINSQIDAPHHFNDLIDTVVNLVQDHRISSLNRDHLSSLRRALLSPVELARFQTKVSRGQECASCGRTLRDMEAVTVYRKQIHCYSCANSEHVTCANCHSMIDVSGMRKTIERQLQKHTCSSENRERARDEDQDDGMIPEDVEVGRRIFGEASGSGNQAISAGGTTTWSYETILTPAQPPQVIRTARQEELLRRAGLSSSPTVRDRDRINRTGPPPEYHIFSVPSGSATMTTAPAPPGSAIEVPMDYIMNPEPEQQARGFATPPSPGTETTNG